MANESEPPQKKPVKRVVKRVVRRPVSRPTAPTPAPAPAASKPAVPAARMRAGKSAESKPAPAKAAATRLRDRFERPSLSRPQLPAAPTLSPATACLLAGLLVGALAVGATMIVMALLDWLRGTPSGGGWGLMALVLILAASIFVGDRALTWLSVPEPRPTSFVGVLLVLVVILGFLLDFALTGWAIAFVPVLGALSFAVVNFAITRLAPTTGA